MAIFSDKASSQNDLLGRKGFALEIANGLKKYASKSTDPITISITGEWGFGKTTLLHYIKEDLRREGKKYRIIEFNPWMFYNRVGSKDNQISMSDYLYCPLTPPCVPFGTRRFVRID